MSSTKKRARSPEVDGPSSTRQIASCQNYQNPRFKKRRWRGPKDDPIKDLQKSERRRRHAVFWDTGRPHLTASDRQPNIRAHHTAPAPVESPRQHGLEPAVPHSPPLLPAGGDEYGLEISNDSPVSSDIPIGSGLPPTSGLRNNRALFRQTRHLDSHTSAWKGRRDNQAIQWKSVVIPRLMPTYLANRAATESGRLPPPRPNHQCQCAKTALKVEMVTWDHKFSPHLLQLLVNVRYQDLRSRYCLPANAIQLQCSWSKWATSLLPRSAQRSPSISTSWSL